MSLLLGQGEISLPGLEQNHAVQVLGGVDEGAVLVEFDPALLPGALSVGDAVRVIYDGEAAGPEPEEIVALEIVKLG